jgi:hypothetical protein
MIILSRVGNVGGPFVAGKNLGKRFSRSRTTTVNGQYDELLDGRSAEFQAQTGVACIVGQSGD